MARTINRLSAKFVEKALKAGRYSDGGNLYLVVAPGGTKSWAFIYKTGGRQREMGLGSTIAVTLARARELATQARAQLADSTDPIDARLRKQTREDDTFQAVAHKYFATKSPSWRNAKVRRDWLPMMERFCTPIWRKPVAEISVSDVERCLRPIWFEKSETARKLRGRIEAVLDAARVRGLMPEDKANAARWRGHLEHLLPPTKRLQRGRHKALPYAELPGFMASLKERPAIAARCLEFLILTASRSGEAMGSRWGEIDFEKQVWTIPGDDPTTGRRMKSGIEHRVPLPDRAIAILKEMQSIREATGNSSDFVFPGQKPGRPMSVMALEMLLRRMQVDATVHGFRSTFRDWCGECTSFPREIAEQALAHRAGDAVELAYRRGDALERRRPLMQAWSDYCSGAEAVNVLPLRRQAQ